MEFDTRLGVGSAALRWRELHPHRRLSGAAGKIALVSLQYARILVAHSETRVELLERIGRGAQSLVDGATELFLEPWYLEAAGRRFVLWPCGLEEPDNLTQPKRYVATLVVGRNDRPRIHLKMAWSATRVLAPLAAIVSLQILTASLDAAGRIKLARTLLAINAYYADASDFKISSEGEALDSALPLLLEPDQ